MSASGFALKMDELIPAVGKLSGGKVLILGDVMLDEYLFGDAERISPEAPVPVVRVWEQRMLVGGAGNVARNIRSLGASAHLVSICGQDAAAEELKKLLRQDGIGSSLHLDPSRPTTMKTRILARQQQMLRVDREVQLPLTEEASGNILASLAALLPDYAVLIISDYGKGLISEKLMRGIQELCRNCATHPRILVDPKVPNLPLYKGAWLLTPNARETSEGSHLPVNTPEEIIRAGRALISALDCEHLLTTLGPMGMALFQTPDEIWHIPTAAREVYDVTGAGDTVIAVTALALSAGLGLLEACLLANYAAGIVVGEVGAATVSKERLQEALRSLPQPQIARWK